MNSAIRNGFAVLANNLVRLHPKQGDRWENIKENENYLPASKGCWCL
jgi:hypothetical protein